MDLIKNIQWTHSLMDQNKRASLAFGVGKLSSKLESKFCIRLFYLKAFLIDES